MIEQLLQTKVINKQIKNDNLLYHPHQDHHHVSLLTSSLIPSSTLLEVTKFKDSEVEKKFTMKISLYTV